MQNDVEKQDKIEDLIVPTKWTDRDTEIVIQSRFDEKLGFDSKYELD